MPSSCYGCGGESWIWCRHCRSIFQQCHWQDLFEDVDGIADFVTTSVWFVATRWIMIFETHRCIDSCLNVFAHQVHGLILVRFHLLILFQRLFLPILVCFPVMMYQWSHWCQLLVCCRYYSVLRALPVGCELHCMIIRLSSDSEGFNAFELKHIVQGNWILLFISFASAVRIWPMLNIVCDFLSSFKLFEWSD